MFNAREYFENIRVTATSYRAACARRDTMTLNDKKQQNGGKPSGTGDPTAAAATALVALDARIEQYERDLDEARCVVNAVGKNVSENAALVLELYYLDVNPIEAVAFEMAWSLSTLYRMRFTAFQWLETVGLAAAREIGQG